jgi:hypothetical protein
VLGIYLKSLLCLILFRWLVLDFVFPDSVGFDSSVHITIHDLPLTMPPGARTSSPTARPRIEDLHSGDNPDVSHLGHLDLLGAGYSPSCYGPPPIEQRQPRRCSSSVLRTELRHRTRGHGRGRQSAQEIVGPICDQCCVVQTLKSQSPHRCGVVACS